MMRATEQDVAKDNMDAIKETEERPPATFEGSLNLSDFLHDQTAPRRSPRHTVLTQSFLSFPVSTGPALKRKKSSSQETGKRENQSETKRKRSNTGNGGGSGSYAPPSKYAHLPLLPDAVGPNLIVLFVGLNPGIQTATSGHAYAHPSNLFWRLLGSSGITPRRCAAQEDKSMPKLFSLGLTNIVSRPSRNGAELSKAEMDDGVAALEEKSRRWRPESVCIVGKSIWESVWRVRHGGKPVGKQFRYGWQDEKENMGVIPGEWDGARVFVATSTSGLAATLPLAEKERIWGELGEWVKGRRAEREAKTEGA